MPSIAQQDYIVIAPKVGGTIVVDAYALGQLAKILEKKDTSIFDVILNYSEELYSKVIATFDDIPKRITFVNSDESAVDGIDIPYTSIQYEGLAAIQEAEVDTGELRTKLPTLERTNDGFLLEEQTGTLITDPEGHLISVTALDAKLASVAVSAEDADPDGIKVPFEDIQKLIGLPISQED